MDSTTDAAGDTSPGGPSDVPTAYAIDATGVELVYDDGTRAVDGIDLQIPTGEFYGFLGPNGAGKTTTIKTLVTLLHPTGGSISVNGHDVTERSRAVRRSVGYMAQETSVDPELTARENVRFACDVYGVPRAERGERIDDLLDLVGLADVADKRSDGFSGGMKKRLDVATALVHRPPLVFLDEPTTGLDPAARNRLWEFFRQINDDGTTIFLTTQYLEEADELCDRIGVIQGGQIVASGSPDELKREVGGERLDVEVEGGEGARERALEVAQDADVFDVASLESTDTGIAVISPEARERGTDLLLALRDAGLTVTGFNVRAPTLDDVFLSITGESTGGDADEIEGAADGSPPRDDEPTADEGVGQ